MTDSTESSSPSEESFTLFKSHAATLGYVFRNGKGITFLEGSYATKDPEEIAELTKECKAGHPNYYIDNNQKTVATERTDPMAVLIAKIREEERAKLVIAIDKERNMGTTDQSGKLLGIANSNTVSGATGASNAGEVTTPGVPASSIKIASK